MSTYILHLDITRVSSAAAKIALYLNIGKKSDLPALNTLFLLCCRVASCLKPALPFHLAGLLAGMQELSSNRAGERRKVLEFLGELV